MSQASEEQGSQRIDRAEIVPPLVFGGLAVAAYVLAGRYPAAAAVFPRVVAVIMFLASVLLFVRTILRPVRVEDSEGGMELSVAVTIMLTFVYVFSIQFLGFFIASALFVPLVTWLLGYRRPILIAVVTAVFIGLLYLIFIRLVRTPLPGGTLIPFLRTTFGG